VDVKVTDIMTTDPVRVEAPGNRSTVLKLLVQNNITGVPVVKEGTTKYVGFVTRQDLFTKADVEQLALIVNKKHPCIQKKDDIRKAAKLLVDHDLHHLPVVENKKLVGIVTPTDLLKIVEKEKYSEGVENYVRKPCIPIYENTPLTVVAAIIKITNAFAFPVLDDDSQLTGIITDRDIFNLSVVDGATAMSDLGSGEDEDEWTWEGLRNIMKLYYEVSKITLPKIPVKEIMVKNPITVFRKTPIKEAARIMRRNDFGQLPIRDTDDRLYAMVDELDVIVCMTK
jgi:CBS domain-containing protein